ncbi:sigma-E processing peptidase SpoIIGA [Bacillus massilinigeriensis]|uniref:sigma-E processing peptidase SpoIIGA n=1 Tax=Bacillus massilionigeriensis TaxID=1805475 RepID=UPI00096B147D|nr:sigma-E processing peptidase SpoIIGA [Bacillus massilionigeriensis]
MTVYIDIIWALNLLFDCLLLYLTAIILKRETKYWRVFLGGFIGSILILLMITPLHTYSSNPLVKLLFSFWMIVMTFGYKRFSYFLNNLLIFYLVTFLIGGALIGTHYFLNFDSELSSSVFLASVNGFGDPISWLFVVLGFPIAWHFSRRNVEKIEMTKIQYDQIIHVTLTIGESTIALKGLIDSGNNLYDPISKAPVMFVSLKNQVDKINQTVFQIASFPDDFIMGRKTLPSSWENKLRIIPYKVVGQENQLIIAIKPDQLIIEHEKEQLVVEKGLVSFTLQQLSSDDMFQCIVHPKMLTGTKKVTSNIHVS